MSTTIRFTKMQGIGNDYIYVDTARYPIDNPAQTAIAWSRPHTGIGADGLVLIGRRTKPTSACAYSMLTARRHACAATPHAAWANMYLKKD